MKNDYTVVLIHYNQPDRIELAYNAWMAQTIQPKKILVIDDGSEFKQFKTLPQHQEIEYVMLPHRENLPLNLNIGIDKVTTEYFIDCEPSLIPVGKYYVEKQFYYLQKYNKRIIPMMIYANDYNDIAKYKQTEIFKFGFGKEYLIQTINEFNMLYELWNTKKTSDIQTFTDFWRPSGGTVCETSEFLRYNEGYHGWGLYDMDYEYRWLKANQTVMGCIDHAIVHINHPKNTNDSFYQAGDNRNIVYYNFCLTYYRLHNVTKLIDYLPIMGLYLKFIDQQKERKKSGKGI